MKIFTGKVIDKKLPKTAAVVVERIITHPVYGKKIKRTKKYLVQDDINVEIGKTVLFAPSRPFSRLKRWRIVKVVDARSNEPKPASLAGKSEKKTGKSRRKESKRK